MKRIKIFTTAALVASLSLTLTTSSCTEGFDEMNTNPKSLPTVNPEQLFYTAEIQYLTAAHCWNTIYAAKFRWMQYGANIWGYGSTGYSYFSNAIGSSIYNEYITMGSYVTSMEYEASLTADPDRYKILNTMARILLIAKGIQASDMYGSLAYSDAWKARNGQTDDASLKPAFDTQETLANTWDEQLKECINTLQTVGNGQVEVKGNDRAYNGDKAKWVKAANAIRLRLASRLLKIKPEAAKAIANEVLAPGNAANIFSSNDDSFILWFDKLYTNIHGGDWHSVRDMEIASYALMDYLNRNEDPRRRMYYVINNLTPENVAAFNADPDVIANPQIAIPDSYGRWVGSTIIYDKWNLVDNRSRFSYYLDTDKDGNGDVDMRPANTPQARLWKGNDNSGSGGNWAPVMTYPDFCFLAAEFVLKHGIGSNKTAQEWYETGVRASLDQWNAIGKFCDILNYEAMTEVEIANFLAKPDIKWSDNTDKALEQIYAQMYIEQFKNVDEAYAQWKRTGYPNTQSAIVTFEQPVIAGTPRIVPRRVKYSYPNDGVYNYDNLKARLDEMVKDPKFGEPDDEYGRVWWDAE
ncbi:MAG: SusD/RagB family nutrient-binding outer membrane lipoprotein [Mediterranea sp.]|jgi:hypothetical protein|nr:SusD/RagB family nutrient-binding outer membrane lipoprotein [Mediterranea sp.]